jgi:phage protein D
MTEALLSSSAPVFTVDGQVRAELFRDLLRLEVEETTAGLKTLTARLLAEGPRPSATEEGLLYLDGAILDFGKPLAVSIGPPSEARTIFRGTISALEAAFHEGQEPEVTAFAEDGLMALRMTRRMKTYTDSTDAQIAEAIAAAHGLKAEAAADGPSYESVQQWNQSDLAFLRERARLIRAEIWFLDGTLFFQARERRHGTEMTLVRGNHILDIELRADLAHQRTSAHVSGYDADARDVIDETADEAALRGEGAGGRTGPAVLERALGARVSHRTRDVPRAGGEATAWARAEMLRRARSFVRVAGTTRGSPEMIVGSRLTLQRVGRPFEGGGYYVTRVCHTYDLTSGHRTRFEAERPTIEERS